MRRCLQYTLYWRDLRSLHQQWCGYSCSPQSSEDKTLNLLCLIAEHAHKELSCREAFFSETQKARGRKRAEAVGPRLS
jgi:hypothetical protein